MTSFAKSISTTPIDAPSVRPEFDETRHKATVQQKECGSTMVERDRPHPAPRPSPDMAMDTDRAAFNETWEREQRRAAFIAMRTDPQTGGRIRVFKRSATRS